MRRFLKITGIVTGGACGSLIAIAVLIAATSPTLSEADQAAKRDSAARAAAYPPSVTAPAAISDPGISMAEFSKIKTGMSYNRVKSIIGGPGEVLSENSIAGHHTIMYKWDGESGFGANANVMFQNRKVIQKSQFGLR